MEGPLEAFWGHSYLGTFAQPVPEPASQLHFLAPDHWWAWASRLAPHWSVDHRERRDDGKTAIEVISKPVCRACIFPILLEEEAGAPRLK